MNKKIRVAVVGCGYRGKYLLRLLSSIDMFEVVCAGDLVEVELEELCSTPFYSGKDCLAQILKNQELDLVVVASVWDSHYDYALEVLESGCNVALEVKGALFEGEYERILEVAANSGRRVYFLENMAFDRSVMSVVEMCRSGLLGRIMWASGSYRHDVRELFFAADSPDHWRARYYKERRGDIYPTHSVAPLVMALKSSSKELSVKSVNSFSTASVGVREYNPSCSDVVLGDVVNTVIETYQGAVINLVHDTTLPRPKSLDYEIQGTKGVWRYEQNSGRGEIYIDGVSPESEQWESDSEYIDKYMNDLWLKHKERALEVDAHHRGMDYVMLCSVGEDMLGVGEYPIEDSDILFWANISLGS